jgi:hypothetical protein
LSSVPDDLQSGYPLFQCSIEFGDAVLHQAIEPS